MFDTWIIQVIPILTLSGWNIGKLCTPNTNHMVNICRPYKKIFVNNESNMRFSSMSKMGGTFNDCFSTGHCILN